ncbi:MAG: hypothetical protein R3271_05865 [Methylophaga sp.]|uniref:hypothetical protein n=1 Tax=Methylophaga sp. TaxID=2024840 RepID=UPI00299F2A35|nr:hypothetical protein [Methylophaga sp.]MDX1749829.1 hypothetical protein [Methylophaga sp.]
MADDNVESSLKLSRWFVSIFTSVVISAYFGWFLLQGFDDLSTKSAVWGAFGDYLGGPIKSSNRLLRILLAYSFRSYSTKKRVRQEKLLNYQAKLMQLTLRRHLRLNATLY